MGLGQSFVGTYVGTLIILFIVTSTNVFAGWTGPQEILQGSWGASQNQFGITHQETEDFISYFNVTTQQKIVIRDKANGRVKVYNLSGSLEATVPYKANLDYKDLTIAELYGFSGDFVGYGEGDVNYFYRADQNVYINFSPTGQLVKTSTTRPLELGKVTSIGVSAGQYRTTAEFPDVTYQFIDTQPTVKFYRDLKSNFFRVETFTDTVGGEDVTAYKVHKYDTCSKKIGLLDMPRSTYEPMPPSAADMPTWKPAPVMEYGEPIVGPNGDVYAWARTTTHYKILKWTWVDDPNVPTGPDAPSGLSVAASINGLYLTWTASPNDPGCVTGYEVARATSAGGVYSNLATVGTGVVKYNDTTANAGTMYYYKVRAKAGTEYSPYTAEASGKR